MTRMTNEKKITFTQVTVELSGWIFPVKIQIDLEYNRYKWAELRPVRKYNFWKTKYNLRTIRLNVWEGRRRGTHCESATYCFIFLIIGHILPVSHRSITCGNCWVTFPKYLTLVRHFFRILCPLRLKETVDNLSRVQIMATRCRGALENRTHWKRLRNKD